MHAGATDAGICFVEFTDRIKLGEELTRLGKELNEVLESGTHAFLDQLEQQLTEYFNGERQNFTIPLHFTGTDFQKAVWKELMKIPFGKTITYKEQAIKMGNLSAIRAIAATNGQNKHAIVVPCHRVIGSNGNLTGYAAGLAKKEWLLRFETGNIGQTLEIPFEELDTPLT